MKKKQKWTVFSVLGLLILLLFAAICIAPFIYMTIMSFTQSTTLMLHWSDINFGDFTNFNYVLKKTGFIRALTNSVIVVFCSCLFNCIIASMAAYGFAKKKFPGSKAIFRIYLLTLMIPGQVTMIPVFIMMNKAGLTNTYFALIVVILNAFGVFLIRQFMDTVPDELLEAAKVDGCPEYRIFIQIVIPLIKPVLISLVVFTFVTSWNDFLLAVGIHIQFRYVYPDGSIVSVKNTVSDKLWSDHGRCNSIFPVPVHHVCVLTETVRGRYCTEWY